MGAERLAALSGLAAAAIPGMVGRLTANPGALPVTAEDGLLDFALASAAVETAMERHAGTIEEVYTPVGPALVQAGKDLTGVERLVLTGGAVIHNPEAKKIARRALFNRANALSLKRA